MHMVRVRGGGARRSSLEGWWNIQYSMVSSKPTLAASNHCSVVLMCESSAPMSPIVHLMISYRTIRNTRFVPSGVGNPCLSCSRKILFPSMALTHTVYFNSSSNDTWYCGGHSNQDLSYTQKTTIFNFQYSKHIWP